MTTKKNKRSSDNSVGYWLWEVRTKQGYSLEEVAEYIRIRPAMLRAIEQDAYENLPGGLYVAGYLKSYGRFLGLDADDVVQRFREQQGIIEQENHYYQPQVVQEEQRFNMKKLLVICAVLVVVISAVWAFATGDARKPAESSAAMPEEMQQQLKPQVDLDAGKVVLPQGDNEPAASTAKPESTASTPAADTEAITQKQEAAPVKPRSKRKHWTYRPDAEVKDLREQTPPATNPQEQPQQ